MDKREEVTVQTNEGKNFSCLLHVEETIAVVTGSLSPSSQFWRRKKSNFLNDPATVAISAGIFYLVLGTLPDERCSRT